LTVPPPYAGGWARDINDNNVVVGSVDGRAARWLSLTDVTVLPNLTGTSSCTAHLVNEHGTTLGHCNDRVVVWTTDDEVIDVGLGRPAGINNRGDVVWNHMGHVFLRANHGEPMDLGTFGGASATAAGLNNRGMIAGSRERLGGGRPEFFVWTKAKGVSLIPTPEGVYVTDVTAINDPGHVVGRHSRYTAGPPPSGCTGVWFWSPADGFREVSCFLSDHSMPDVNNDDIVAASVMDFDEQSPGVLWHSDGTRIAEYTLGSISWVRAVNGLGVAVGSVEYRLGPSPTWQSRPRVF
jgi:hypothetical protein